MAEHDSLTASLANHPRLIGALVAMCLLLSKAGSAAAANGGTIA